ncbi:SCO family protein [Alsobacter sp. R-9]
MRLHSSLATVAMLALSLSAGALPALAGGSRLGNPVSERTIIIESDTETSDTPQYRPPRVEDLGGPFTMIAHTGETVSQDSYPGKYLVVTFGFPGCRESCPVALDHLSRALEILGPDAGKVQTLFVDISMDRKPDPRAMGQFLSNFHESIVGLVGTRAQVSNMVRNFKVRRQYAHLALSARETGPRIDHSTYVFVIDPQRKTRGYFYHNLAPEQMAEALRAAIKE